MNIENNSWKFDRSVPVTVIFLLLVQVGTAIWWGGQQNEVNRAQDVKLQRLERRIDATEALKEDMATIKNDITWIKGWLEKYGK